MDKMMRLSILMAVAVRCSDSNDNHRSTNPDSSIHHMVVNSTAGHTIDIEQEDTYKVGNDHICHANSELFSGSNLASSSYGSGLLQDRNSHHSNESGSSASCDRSVLSREPSMSIDTARDIQLLQRLPTSRDPRATESLAHNMSINCPARTDLTGHNTNPVLPNMSASSMLVAVSGGDATEISNSENTVQPVRRNGTACSAAIGNDGKHRLLKNQSKHRLQKISAVKTTLRKVTAQYQKIAKILSNLLLEMLARSRDLEVMDSVYIYSPENMNTPQLPQMYTTLIERSCLIPGKMYGSMGLRIQSCKDILHRCVSRLHIPLAALAKEYVHDTPIQPMRNELAADNTTLDNRIVNNEDEDDINPGESYEQELIDLSDYATLLPKKDACIAHFIDRIYKITTFYNDNIALMQNMVHEYDLKLNAMEKTVMDDMHDSCYQADDYFQVVQRVTKEIYESEPMMEWILEVFKRIALMHYKLSRCDFLVADTSTESTFDKAWTRVKNQCSSSST